MLRKKVCMVGAPGVGKTSLVRRFVDSMFSDDYLSTVGVKIDRKVVTVDGDDITLMVWDIHGEEGPLRILPSYLKGAAGIIAVIDATRPAETAAVAADIVARPELAGLPIAIALNKADLEVDWPKTVEELDRLFRADTTTNADMALRTSAKEGTAVEELFAGLARRMLA